MGLWGINIVVSDLPKDLKNFSPGRDWFILYKTNRIVSGVEGR